MIPEKRISKVVRIGKNEIGNVFCRIEFEKGRLSITGVEEPKRNGDCKGSCGQICEHLNDFKEFADGWNDYVLKQFVNVWQHWHLNDMRAGCEHQRAANWGNDSLSKPCPKSGYKYGTKWLFEKVPNDVIYFLEKLPETDKQPAWC